MVVDGKGGEESVCGPFIKVTRECLKKYNDQFFLPMNAQGGEHEGGKKKKRVFFFSFFSFFFLFVICICFRHDL